MMRALVVDDVSSMRHFLGMCLAGFKELEVDHAEDGIQALRLLKESRYAVALLDLNLPLMDGLKVLSSLRQEEEREDETPVIVISTTSDQQTQKQVRELRALFLAKQKSSPSSGFYYCGAGKPRVDAGV